MFERATRLKLRFNYKGLCQVEDLWDIQVKKENDEYVSELNTIYCELEAMKNDRQKGLYVTRTVEDEIIDLKQAIIKYIFETKKQELIVRENVIARANRKQKLLGVIATKQDAELHDMSVEELNKLVDEL